MITDDYYIKTKQPVHIVLGINDFWNIKTNNLEGIGQIGGPVAELTIDDYATRTRRPLKCIVVSVNFAPLWTTIPTWRSLSGGHFSRWSIYTVYTVFHQICWWVRNTWFAIPIDVSSNVSHWYTFWLYKWFKAILSDWYWFRWTINLNKEREENKERLYPFVQLQTNISSILGSH